MASGPLGLVCHPQLAAVGRWSGLRGRRTVGAGSFPRCTWVEAERATLLAVAAHAASHRWAAHATRLAATIHGYLYERSPAEGLTIHGLALDAARALGHETGDRFGIADSLMGLAEIDCVQGRYQEAEDHAREALAVTRRSSVPTFEAQALVTLAAICHWRGRYVLAAGYCQQALAICEELSDRAWEVEALNTFGQTLLATGQPDKARACHTAALDLARHLSIVNGQARSLMGLGEVGRWHGDHGEAHGYYQQALDQFRDIDNPWGEAEALNGTGEALAATGQYEKARAYLTEALTLTERTGYRYY